MNAHKSLDAGLEDIVFGLVAPIGTDLDPVCRALAVTLERLGYVSRLVRLTDYLHEDRDKFKLDLEHANEAERYEKYMTAGTTFRKMMGGVQRYGHVMDSRQWCRSWLSRAALPPVVHVEQGLPNVLAMPSSRIRPFFGAQ